MIKWLVEKYTSNGVQEGTYTNYIRDLKTMAGVKRLTNMEFLNDVEEVKKRLALTKTGKPVSDNTYRNRLTGILATIKFLEVPETLKATYKSMHDEISKKLKAIELSGEKNEKQKAYYMTKEEVADKIESLKEKIEESGAHFKYLQNLLIFSLYTTITPRRSLDYWLMDVIEEDVDWRTLPIERNYYMRQEQLFVYNQHKNTRYSLEKGIVERISIKDNAELIKLLDEYIALIPKPKKNQTHKILLCNPNGTRLDRAGIISDRITAIVGKKVGTNALRHIISEHNAPPREQLDNLIKTAKESGHDLKTHMTIYIKKTTY